MKRIAALLIAAGISLPCLGADGAAAEPVTIRIGDVGKFEVIMHRTEMDGMGGVVAGVVGVAVQEANHASKDRKETEKILPFLKDPTCAPSLVSAMTEAFKASGVYKTDESDEKDANVAIINVDECGLRLVDTSEQKLAAFVDFQLEFWPGAKRSDKWVEKIQVTGRNRYPLADFSAQADLASTEMLEALKRAGGRAANKIIYSKGRGSK